MDGMGCGFPGAGPRSVLDLGVDSGASHHREHAGPLLESLKASSFLGGPPPPPLGYSHFL